MAYQYANWPTIVDLSARLVALNAHIAEVSELVTASTASGGHSRDSSSLVQRLADLERQRDVLEKRVDSRSAGGPRKVRFTEL